MSTHASIGILESNGTVRYVYLHSDGYPEYAGAVLEEHYCSEQRAKDLIALGDISSLAPNLYPSSEDHSFKKREKDVTVFYIRDRNEDANLCSARTISSIEFHNVLDGHKYLFKDGGWHYYFDDSDVLIMTDAWAE